MAVYLNINSKFKPFSYQELLAPIQAQTAAHKDIENQYGELGTLASVWKNRLNKDIDKEAYALYENYINDLQEQADALYREGLNPNSAKNLIALKNRYASDITPIDEAWKKREDLIKEQRGLSMQDKSIRFDKDASLMSIDDFFGNNSTYKAFSGNELTDYVSKAVSNLKEELKDEKYSLVLGDQYWKVLTQTGLSSQEITEQLMTDGRGLDPNHKGRRVLGMILDQAVDSTGIYDWDIDDDTKNKLIEDAYGFASKGLWSAIGQTKSQYLSNKYYDYTMKAAAKGNQNEPKLYYRNAFSVDVDKDVRTTRLNNAKEFAQSLNKDNLKENFYTGRNIPVQYALPEQLENQPVIESTKSKGQELNRILKQYGFNPIDIDNISQEELNKTIQQFSDYVDEIISTAGIFYAEPTYNGNETSHKHLNETLLQNVSNRSHGNKKNTGVYELNNNDTKGNLVKLKKVEDIFTKGNNTFVLSRHNGFIINHIEDGKITRYVIDLDVVDTSKTIEQYYNAMKKYQKEGATALANQYKNSIFKVLHYISESKVQAAGQTTTEQDNYNYAFESDESE